MSDVGAPSVPDELPESQKTALVKLLGDDDPAIYQSIRQKILSFGAPAADWLRPYALSRDPAVRRRAQEIVLRLDRQTADNRFLGFCLKQGEELDLEKGAWLLAQTQYPDINVAGYQALLDSFADDLRESVKDAKEAEEILRAINYYCFDRLGFIGNEENYYDPENSYLNRVLDRRKGNPVNLCLVYLLLARRLSLPIVGIGLPGHFICRYQSSSFEVFIDPFNHGKLKTKAECIRYLLQGNYSVRDDYLAPVSPRRLLLRACVNLHQIYLHLQKSEDATRLQRYLVALTPR